MIGIYKIVNRNNGKVYIGQTTNFKNRIRNHELDHRRENDRRGQTLMYSDMRKQGFETFDFKMIETCKVDELDEREKYYILAYNSIDEEIGYNLTAESKGFRDERIIKASHAPEIMAMHGKRIREWNLRQWKDPVYRKERSEFSSDLQKERLKDPDYLKEKSAQLKVHTDSIKREVGQFDKQGNLIATFEGVREAERAMNLPNDTIGKVCRGVKYRKTAKGYIWKYL